jgi:hypothetical protein
VEAIPALTEAVKKDKGPPKDWVDPATLTKAAQEAIKQIKGKK